VCSERRRGREVPVSPLSRIKRCSLPPTPPFLTSFLSLHPSHIM